MSANDASQVQRLIEKFAAYPESAACSAEVWKNMTCEVLAARAFECYPQWKMLPRSLPNDVFFFVLTGQGHARVSSRKYRLRSGFCLHARRGWQHEVEHDPKAPLHVLVIHYTALIDFSLTLPEVLGFPGLFDLREDELSLNLLWEICRQASLGPPGWQEGVNAAALAFLFRLIQQHGGQLKPTHPKRLTDLARMAPVIRRMRESLSNPASIDDYAAKACLSAPQLRRIFRRTIGMSPNQYIRKLRMEHAAFLLRNTSGTIETISREVGYSEPAFFAKTFKSTIGRAPGAYRKLRDFMEP